jgi:hypothetical protein
MTAGVRFCPKCGREQGPGSAGVGSPVATRPAMDFSRLRPGDLVAGIGALLAVISLFLPWYDFGISAATVQGLGQFPTAAQQQTVSAICAA